MKKIACTFLAVFFLFGLGCRLTGSSGQGYIVYSAVGEDGKPLSELVVLDPNGKELRRITMPADEKYGNLYITNAYHHPSHQAFVYTPGGVHYLIDVTSGEVKPVHMPGVSAIQGDANPLYICPRLSIAGEHWTVLCQDNTPYLVNLETAEVYAGLPQSAEDKILPFEMAFSPDESYLSIRTNEGIFILPPASPEDIRQVGESDKILYVDFSADNKRIVYIRPADSQGYEVIVENVDGSKSGVMHTSEKMMQAVFVPGKDQILVIEREKILLLSLSNRIEKEFPALAISAYRPLFSPDGQQALLGYNDFEAGVNRWQWLELKRGIAEELPELEGYRTGPTFRGQRWITFNDINPGSRQEEAHLVSVDLQTGSVQTLVTLENILQYYENSISANGNSRTAIVFTTESQMQLWLLDLAGGEARLLVEDTSVRGEISPDGKRVLVYSRHRDGERFENKIELQDISGKTLKSLGEGFSPFWVWP